MSNYKHWSDEERREHYEFLCDDFESDHITEDLFRTELGKLGYNATDIEDIVREHKPKPPENSDGDHG